MASFDDVVIISGCRTPVGKFQGSLSEFSAPQLGAMVVREAVKRAGVDAAQVDECIMGNVISAGVGEDTTRQGGVFCGVCSAPGALTKNKNFGSGVGRGGVWARHGGTRKKNFVVAGGR